MGVKAIAWDVPGAAGAFDYEVLAVDDKAYAEAMIDKFVKYHGARRGICDHHGRSERCES